MRARSKRTAALAVAVWLAAGGAGAVTYVHRYWMYRGFPPPVTPPGIPRGSLRLERFYSPSLRARRAYDVYLPPGYPAAARAGRRFPVMYLLHAPPGRPDGFFQAGAAAVDANELIARHAIRPLLLVAPFGKTPRYRSDTEWANAGAGRYEDYVLDVVHDVDRRFATVRDRSGRTLAGLSEGGYGAVNVGLHHLGMFAGLQSWSGYFTQTPTAAFTHATPEQLRANSPAAYVPALAPRIRRAGLRVFLYQGTHDDVHPALMRGFAAELRAAGASVRTGVFPGGHDWGLWRRQMPRMLVVASRASAPSAE